MLEIPVNQLNVSNISFQSKHKKRNNNRENGTQKGMKTSTKVLLGTTALAAVAVAGIMAAKALKTGIKPVKDIHQFMDSVVERTDKPYFRLNEDEMLEWGQIQILKAKEVLKEKRDLSKWENGTFEDGDCVIERVKEKYNYYDNIHSYYYRETIRKGDKNAPDFWSGELNVDEVKTDKLVKTYNGQGELIHVWCCDSESGRMVDIINRCDILHFSVVDPIKNQKDWYRGMSIDLNGLSNNIKVARSNVESFLFAGEHHHRCYTQATAKASIKKK